MLLQPLDFAEPELAQPPVPASSALPPVTEPHPAQSVALALPLPRPYPKAQLQEWEWLAARLSVAAKLHSPFLHRSRRHCHANLQAREQCAESQRIQFRSQSGRCWSAKTDISRSELMPAREFRLTISYAVFCLRKKGGQNDRCG